MSARYQLVPLRHGGWGIRSLEYDEICHPGVGPKAEAEALYVHGLELPRRFREHAERHPAEREHPFVIWDVGLGGAANATAVIEAARGTALRLRVVSFDRTVAQLAFALENAAELGCFGELEPAARRLLETCSAEFLHGQAQVQWTVVLGDFPSLMASGESRALPTPHAILFDPHSPAANPEMWTLPLFTDLYRHLSPNQPCGLATYSRGTAIRAALLLAGFCVGAGGTTEAKEDTTVATNQLGMLRQPLGRRWLERAQRSRAAEPWTRPPFGGRALSPETWQRLREHPQFRNENPPL